MDFAAAARRLVSRTALPPTPSAARTRAQWTRRLTIWGSCLASYVIVLILLRSVKTATGLDPFSIVLQGFIPLGAAVVAALAISGYVVAAKYFNWTADWRDMLFLMTACLALQFIIIGVDYWTLMLAKPELSKLTYGRFFAWSLTSPEFLVMDKPRAIGEAGYILLLPRLGALMALAKYVHSMFEVNKAYTT